MSCLFDSIGHYLNAKSNDVREQICNYLKSSNELIEGVETKDLLGMNVDKYVKKMRKNTTWGGGIEIKCACNIWNLKIILKNMTKSNMTKKNMTKSNKRSRTSKRTLERTPRIKFIPTYGTNSNTKKIYLSWNGYHYTPEYVY